jgi:hypothetical protein
MEMQGHQAWVPLFLGMTHQQVSSVEPSVAACDNLTSNEPPLAVLSFFKKRLISLLRANLLLQHCGWEEFP